MPCQNHRERDRCEDHIQDEAVVEQAQSGFGGEAFRPLLDHVADSVPTFFLDLKLFVYFWHHFVSNLGLWFLINLSRLVTFAATMS